MEQNSCSSLMQVLNDQSSPVLNIMVPSPVEQASVPIVQSVGNFINGILLGYVMIMYCMWCHNYFTVSGDFFSTLDRICQYFRGFILLESKLDCFHCVKMLFLVESSFYWNIIFGKPTYVQKYCLAQA